MHTHRPRWLARLARSKDLEGILFVLPYAIVWAVFLFWPVVYGFYISLFKWQPLIGSQFIGLKNYINLLHDTRFWNALTNTFGFAALAMPLIIRTGLLFALFICGLGRRRGGGFIEASFFWPYLLNVSIISIVWKWLVDPDFGLILSYLRTLGLNPPVFLNDPLWAVPAIAVATAWWLAGYRMIVFRAAMEDIPDTIFELADLDGANPLVRLFRILLPLLKPAILFALVLTAISSFRVLGQVLMMTDGGPGRASEVLALYLYRAGWQYLEMGRAAAIGFVLFVIILVVTLLGFRLIGFESELGGR